MEGEGPRAGSLEVLAEKAEVTEGAATEEAMAAVAKVVAKVVATVEAVRAVAEWAARPVAVAGKGRPRHTRRQQSLACRVHERLL